MGPKIKNAQNSLKFGMFDISNSPIFILMLKCFYQISIFVKF